MRHVGAGDAVAVASAGDGMHLVVIESELVHQVADAAVGGDTRVLESIGGRLKDGAGDRNRPQFLSRSAFDVGDSSV